MYNIAGHWGGSPAASLRRSLISLSIAAFISAKSCICSCCMAITCLMLKFCVCSSVICRCKFVMAVWYLSRTSLTSS